MKLTRKAHAKLNLFLEVTGKRGDFYHELYSFAVFLDLADEITIETADKITITEANNNSGLTDNIILKTANALAEKYKVKSGAKITFTKNIPIGAGLGGGSADAAVTLVSLNNLWDLRLSHEEMYILALELGADVPVCLYSILENKNAAIFKGVGEIIAPAPQLPKMFFTLANPGVQLTTKSVFANFKYEGLGYEPLSSDGDFIKNIITRSNDLEQAAIELVPEIETALNELAAFKTCQLARMTGSGATSFGIFKSRKDARAAAVAMIKNHPQWQIGPVGVKPISAFSKWQKFRRKTLYKQVVITRALRDSKLASEFAAIFRIMHVRPRLGRAVTLSIAVHLIALFFYDTSFIRHHIRAQPEFITVAFAAETPPPDAINVANYEPAAGEEPQIMPESVVVEKPKPVKKKPAKPSVKKLGAKPHLLNTAKAGNSKTATKPVPKDYLALLQYTVQERSRVPNADPDLRGKAILSLVFNRRGYVLTYKLKQATGIDTLDLAAEKLAKNLMDNPLPPAPDDFERGEEILQYDFMVSYPPSHSPLEGESKLRRNFGGG